MVQTITPSSLFDLLRSKKQLTIIDVRPKKEFTRWSMYNSLNIPLGEFQKHAHKLKSAQTVVVVCNNGNESKRAVNMLSGKGLQAMALTGGMKAWSAIYDFVPIEEKHSTLRVYQCKRLGKGCLSYIIVLPDQKSTLIIDPTSHTQVFENFLKKNKLKAIAVLDTHIHADHVSGAKKLSQKFKIPYLLPKLSDVEFPFKAIEDELPRLAVGATIQIVPTPGHTPECISLIFDEIFLISGDTLFVDAVSRADLGENFKEATAHLFESITNSLFKLKDRIHVLPAHTTQSMIPGPLRTATLRYVKLFNPIKEFPNYEAFAAFIKEQRTPESPNYKKIKDYNRAKTIPRGVDIDALELGGNFCAIARVE